MFTFGRDHERKCAVQYLRNSEDVQLITDVVDGVHDLFEGKSTSVLIRPIIIRAFSEGGSGVWEQTGSWLLKISAHCCELQSVWSELSTSPNGKVRFRVACFLNELPKPLAFEIGDHLKDDCNKKTREMAQARMEEIST